eukprot:COSAG05_NODE_18946_length_300_cov_0.935323_1_plen_41_part_10
MGAHARLSLIVQFTSHLFISKIISLYIEDNKEMRSKLNYEK